VNLSDLIRQSQARDKDAFTELVQFYKKDVYLFILRQIVEERTAEEILADVFVRLWNSIKNFRFESKFTTYLLSITQNVIRNHIDNVSKERVREKPLSAIKDMTDKMVEGIADGLEKKEVKEKLHQCLNRLPDKEKIVITSHFINGLKFHEIARILSIPVSTAKDICNRAKIMLFNCLKSKGVSNDL